MDRRKAHESHELNKRRLAKLDESIRPRVEAVLNRMYVQGFTPVIHSAVFRTPAEQLAMVKRGVSKLRWGFHNAQTPDGRPGSLAADIVDAVHGWDAPPSFWLALGRAAQEFGLGWGGFFGLTDRQKKSLRELLNKGGIVHKPVFGWDVAHVETAFVTVAQAKKGQRGTAAQIAFNPDPIIAIHADTSEAGAALGRLAGAIGRDPILAPDRGDARPEPRYLGTSLDGKPFDYEDSGANLRTIHETIKGASPDAEPAKTETTVAPVAPEGAPAVPDSAKPGEAVIGARPSDPIHEVESRPMPWHSRIAAVFAPITAILTGAGITIGGVQITPAVLIAFFVFLGIALIVGAFLYNESRKRSHEKTKLSQQALADPARYNVSLVPVTNAATAGEQKG